jgi:hypothetical protein
MEEVKFCEDCKWCSANCLPWYKRIFEIQKRCFRPELNRHKVSRSDTEPCYEHRSCYGACGREGMLYEPKEVK